MRKREIVKKLSPTINLMVYCGSLLPKKFHKFTLSATRGWQGYFGMLVRYVSLKNLCKECGDNVAVFSNVYILNPENLKLGNNVSIHPMCYIDSLGGITIQSNVSIAHATTILSTEHLYDDLEQNIKDQGYKYDRTVIESNVWIGAGVRILAGSKVSSGSIIAAGAVVKKTVPNNSVYGGIPAKLIKLRDMK